MRTISTIASVCFCAFALAQGGDRPFRDCAECPEMVAVPAGSFTMGSPSGEPGRTNDEGPRHLVTISKPFAVGKYEVTFDEWNACVAAGGCGGHRPGDNGWGRGSRPVLHVNWNDAQAYVSWLSRRTGYCYRLLSESEWEYAARAGTTSLYSVGTAIATHQANYDGRRDTGIWRRQTVEVGGFAANGFGLHDMDSNVAEWIEDCWHEDYTGAPADGSAWVEGGNCEERVVRGGAWRDESNGLRSANRSKVDADIRSNDIGIRVARTL